MSAEMTQRPSTTAAATRPLANIRASRTPTRVNWRLTALMVVCSLTVLIPLYLTVVTALKTPEQLGGSGFALPNPRALGELLRRVDPDQLPAHRAEQRDHHGRRGAADAGDQLDGRLRDLAQPGQALLQVPVLLLRGGAVHPVPDHHAAGGEADGAAGAGQPGRPDPDLRGVRTGAEHLRLRRLPQLHPARPGGGRPHRRRQRLDDLLAHHLPAAGADQRATVGILTCLRAGTTSCCR